VCVAFLIHFSIITSAPFGYWNEPRRYKFSTMTIGDVSRKLCSSISKLIHNHTYDAWSLVNTEPSPPDLEDQVGHAAMAICICSVCVLKQTSGMPMMPFTNIPTHSSYSYSHSTFNKSTRSFCSRFSKKIPCWLFCGIDEC